MSKITIGDFLTDAEIKKAIKLKRAPEIKEKIIEPNMTRINKSLGQENDTMYLAYMVEFVVSHISDNSK